MPRSLLRWRQCWPSLCYWRASSCSCSASSASAVAAFHLSLLFHIINSVLSSWSCCNVHPRHPHRFNNRVHHSMSLPESRSDGTETVRVSYSLRRQDLVRLDARGGKKQTALSKVPTKMSMAVRNVGIVCCLLFCLFGRDCQNQ